MDAATRKHLDDLARDGFDVSSFEAQINNNPILEKVAEKKIGGGLLRLDDYSRFMSKTKEENLALENKVKELAALHDSSGALQGNEDVYKVALQVIADQEAALIAAGFDEAEVKELSFANKTKLTVPSEKKVDKVIVKPEEKIVPNFDEKTYIDAETFNKQQEQTIYNNITMTGLVQEAFEKARALGIKVAPEVARNLASNVFNGVKVGKTIDQVFDEQFGFSATEAIKREEKHAQDVKDAEARGRAEAFKEGPPQRHVSREKHAIFDNISPVKIEDTRKPREELLKDLPRNKFGDVEYRLLRGDKDDRITRAAIHYENVQNGSLANAE